MHPNEERQLLTSRLRQIRAARGETLTSLAIRSGVEPAMLSIIERGKRPSRPTANKLAGALGLATREVWPDCDNFRPY